METESLKLLLWEYLPTNFDLEKYELEKIEKDENLDKYHPFLWKIDIYFKEKNIKPEKYKNNPNIISKWFYDYKNIKDSSVRFKLTELHIKQRKWYDTVNNKVIKSNKIELDWIKSTPENIFFYKD